MVKGLIGKKVNMSQGFDSHGRVAPITTVLVEPNYVVQIKEADKDNYKSVQLGFGQVKKLTKPLESHVKKSKLDHLPRYLREFNFDGDISIGQEIKVGEVFSKGSLVDVVGVSKGKGFAGVVKRHGFAGGPRTHGQSDRERAPGSIGATTTPGRVLKGTKMAGHMGAERVKVQALEVFNVDEENNVLMLKGSVPGFNGSILLVEESKKKGKKYHEPEIPVTPSVSKKDGGEETTSDESKPGEPEKDTGKEKEALFIEQKEEQKNG